MEKTLYVTHRDEWRNWLEKNHNKKIDIWLIYYKKHTGKPRIPYDDAVEEALCYGWIDSIVKRIDDERFMQKFTPRQENSMWSAHNKKRALEMIRLGRMTEAGIVRIDAAKKTGAWDNVVNRSEAPAMPADLKRALDADKNAKQSWEDMAPSRRKQHIWWIADAKRNDTRKRRIEKTLEEMRAKKKGSV